MARFAILAICIATCVAVAQAGSMDYSTTMASRAYEAVCWYEYLKIFPNTNTDSYMKCNGQALQVKKGIDNPSPQNKRYMESDPEAGKKLFGKQLQNFNRMEKLPSEYKANCVKFLNDPDLAPTVDEADALNDSPDYDYPYKGFAYCMMQTLRTKHGNEAIEAVKNERTHKLKHWMKTLLDRENEFRARHGSPPLKLNKELVNAAQAWADNNAKKCDSYHSDDSTPGTKFQGKDTGESLSAGGGKEDKEVAAYIAADGWYEENKDYKYQEYNGDGTDSYFMSIGHFTQSVWKDTQYVGYGFAYNGDCEPQFTNYVVARYYPAGNMGGSYMKNVLPPK